MKKTLLHILVIIVAIILLMKLAIHFDLFDKMSNAIKSHMRNPVITTDIADYGVIAGNRDNETPKEFIDAFFPAVIEDYFSEPEYYCRGQKIDTCACEVYLEFTINDPAKFNEHYESLMQFGTPQNAYFDNRYEIWFAGDNVMHFSDCSKYEHDKEAGYYIGLARLGTILCDKEQQRFVYSAIYVWDGGFATTEHLGHFFHKFGIDPREFMIEYSLCPDSIVPDCQH